MAAAVGPLAVLPDGSFALFISPTTYTAVRDLAADTAEYINVPTGAKYAVFGSTGSFACRYNATQAGTAAASYADATGGDTTEINPTVRYLNGVTELSVIAPAITQLSVTFFK